MNTSITVGASSSSPERLHEAEWKYQKLHMRSLSPEQGPPWDCFGGLWKKMWTLNTVSKIPVTLARGESDT